MAFFSGHGYNDTIFVFAETKKKKRKQRQKQSLIEYKNRFCHLKHY